LHPYDIRRAGQWKQSPGSRQGPNSQSTKIKGSHHPLAGKGFTLMRVCMCTYIARETHTHATTKDDVSFHT